MTYNEMMQVAETIKSQIHPTVLQNNENTKQLKL
jgi:hypothetical protein